MKKRLGVVAAVICVAVAMCAAAVLYSSALYNDVTFESYTNMSADSAIPSLFRNDSVFDSYKQHPPVITDGIEYVPLEIFYGLSGVKISYSDDGSNFYIQNKNTNKYISFSIPGEYAVTGAGNVYETKVHTFYDVHYVPLRTVCNATGIGCDSYNDGINKIYVIKVYTAPGLSARDLIRIHAPSIYAPEEPEPVVPDTPNGSDVPQPDVGKDEQDQKPEEFPPRTLYLFFDGESLEGAGETLDMLATNGICAVFYADRDSILAYPDTVRRIYTEGHTLVLKINAEPQELCAEDGLEGYCREGLDALYDVTKTKTRLVLLPDDPEGLYAEAGIEGRVSALGLAAVKTNLDSRTDTLSAYTATARLTDSLRRLERTHGTRSAYIRLIHNAAGRSTAAGLVSLAIENPAVRVEGVDETTE